MRSQFYSFTKIFDYSITPKSKLVYIFLCSMANRNAVCFPSKKTVAAACGLCVESVKRAVRELAAAGLLLKQEQHKENGRQTSNLYTIVRIDGDHYFTCDKSIFQHDIPTNAKLVLCYLQRCSKEGASFPSQAQISLRTGLCVSSIQSCIQIIEAIGLVEKHAQYRDNGGRTNNLYTQAQPDTVEQDKAVAPIVICPKQWNRVRPYWITAMNLRETYFVAQQPIFFIPP